ncbi:MAG TPA: acetyl-CoA carboxylase biotin carboxyl carrier protein subunit [Actinomycetota bacterium]|nr:acetyl-CoA carboxylase biotin carboxyl carrier protein subunit [Actinomycetota bacterium]
MAHEIKSPMVGKVFRIECAVGQTINEGDVVIVLESMKMEMPVEADASGVVQSIPVQVEQTVQEGDVLVVLG